MLKGDVIQLSREERDLAYKIGTERHEENRMNGVNPRLISGVDELRADREGVAGEMAFSKGLGQLEQDLPRLLDTELRSVRLRTDDGDITYKGLVFDVKTTKYPNGHLLIKEHQLNASVYGYVLITGWFGRYCFRGWLEQGRVKELGELKGGVYWVKQDVLNNFLI